MLAFVIQMNGITEVRPNTETHPGFGEAWNEALSAGVEIVFFLCRITEDEIVITDRRISPRLCFIKAKAR